MTTQTSLSFQTWPTLVLQKCIIDVIHATTVATPIASTEFPLRGDYFLDVDKSNNTLSTGKDRPNNGVEKEKVVVIDRCKDSTMEKGKSSAVDKGK